MCTSTLLWWLQPPPSSPGQPLGLANLSKSGSEASNTTPGGKLPTDWHAYAVAGFSETLGPTPLAYVKVTPCFLSSPHSWSPSLLSHFSPPLLPWITFNSNVCPDNKLQQPAGVFKIDWLCETSHKHSQQNRYIMPAVANTNPPSENTLREGKLLHNINSSEWQRVSPQFSDGSGWHGCLHNITLKWQCRWQCVPLYFNNGSGWERVSPYLRNDSVWN